MCKFISFVALVVVGISLPAITLAEFSSQSTGKPLRVAIVGLVHGHVAGFLGPALKRSDIQIVRIVEAAARHRIPVMMEKPLSVSVEDALAIKRAADAAHIPVLVNYETTWYPSNTAVYQLVRDGALGDIRKVVVHDGHRGPKEINVEPEFLSWLTDPARNGAGALFDFGCYGADLMTWLMQGATPITVTAVTQQ